MTPTPKGGADRMRKMGALGKGSGASPILHLYPSWKGGDWGLRAGGFGAPQPCSQHRPFLGLTGQGQYYWSIGEQTPEKDPARGQYWSVVSQAQVRDRFYRCVWALLLS